MHTYALAKYPTPVLNRPDFSSCFGGEKGDRLLLDDQHLLRAVETILFPLASLELLEKMPQPHIWRARTKEYPSQENLYVDERFLISVETRPPQRLQMLPSKECILEHLQELIGARYIWGGNWPQGIAQLLEWYAPSIAISNQLQEMWQLKGVDCSGLLYFATQGFTPRNTSQLVQWGESLPIGGKGLDAILDILLPLDLIVWKGHVIVVFDKTTAVESKAGHGVVTAPLQERLDFLLKEKKAVDSYITSEPAFVINRWLCPYLLD
ncbi:MAG TPA: hypothetical protein VGJ00_02005 [Rhabdochlamydiaceae bacterium]|jgi:hypothetical protein